MYFFATSNDIQNVISYMIEELDFVIYQAYSEFDKPISQITSDVDIPQLEDRNKNILIRAWREDFNSPPIFKTIKSRKPELFTERTVVTNLAQIQINKQKLMDNGALYPTYISHWSEKGARQRAFATEEELESVDWNKLKSISSKLKRQIRVKMSVAKLNTMVILPDAYKKLSTGQFSLWNMGNIVEYSSPEINS